MIGAIMRTVLVLVTTLVLAAFPVAKVLAAPNIYAADIIIGKPDYMT
jgi:hypothetical protein